MIKTFLKPCAGRISSKFGSRLHPITKSKSFHNGVDIACYLGTPIFAPATGTITEAWTHHSGGHSLVMVSLIENVRFGFAHLDSYNVKKSDKVSKGDIIAYSGNSGKSTGPHLHFTVKKNGQWVDPESVIQF
ncbi:MAG: M23 family metallopeptidase [Bacteroidetes bacterium]|jgi:murein DD-endopeptidase MepM/ murein hydrolase activator NlpD|nr:M23 family metallopeptidase [Bacteroidota bacterium]